MLLRGNGIRSLPGRKGGLGMPLFHVKWAELLTRPPACLACFTRVVSDCSIACWDENACGQ